MPVRHLSCVDGSACGLEKVYNFTSRPALSTVSLSAPNTCTQSSQAPELTVILGFLSWLSW